MPRIITETDLGMVQIVITQQEVGRDPSVIVTGTTKNDTEGSVPGRALPVAEMYSQLGVQAQTLIKSVCTSIRNRAKTQEGI